MRPKSSSSTFIWRKSIALTVPSVTGTSYVSPVRLSVTVSVLSRSALATPPPSFASVWSSAIAALSSAGSTQHSDLLLLSPTHAKPAGDLPGALAHLELREAPLLGRREV